MANSTPPPPRLLVHVTQSPRTSTKISDTKMTSSEQQRAFIAAHARAPLTVAPKSFCSRRPYRRRPPNRWTCTLQEGTPDEVQSLPRNDAHPAEEHGQREGVVSLDSIDVDFEEALSKKWDTLDMFDDGPSPHATQNPKSVVQEEEDKQQANLDVAEQEVTSEHAEDVAPEKKKRPRKAKKKKVVEKSRDRVQDSEEEWNTDARWYFVQVKPGCEQSCAISMRNMSASVEDTHIHEVLVPTTKIMRLTKGGKAVSKEERFFPGYIIVLVSMSRFSYTQILRVPNVQCFMNDPNRDKKKNDPFRPPLPVKDSEMKLVFEKMRDAESAKPEVKTSVRPGDPVEIMSGPYQGNKGRVTEVKPDLNIVKTELVIFGRISAIELEFHQVQVIEEAELEAYLTKNDAVREKMDVESKKNEGSSKLPRIEAGVASAEDDLMSLLKDIGDETEKREEYNLDDDEGFASSENVDDSKEPVSEALSTGAEVDWKDAKLREERKEKSDDQLFDDFLFGSGAESDEGLLSSDGDLASFLSEEDDADLWQLDEGEKSPPSMFDDTDDGFEPLSDVKQGASSLIDEAEHPFNSPDDGFVEVNKTGQAKRRNQSRSAKPKDVDNDDLKKLRGVTFVDEAGDDESFMEELDIDFEMDDEMDAENESGDAGDGVLSEEELEEDFKEAWNEMAKENPGMQDWVGDSAPAGSAPDVATVGQKPTQPTIGCQNLPRQMISWPEEDELPLVPPEDVHRIGGEAFVQDLFAELRRVEREDDRKYEFPPPGYDVSKPIVEVAVDTKEIDIMKPDTREWPVCEEFDYEEVKRKSRAMHKARKEARRQRREDESSDSSTNSQS
ncbi:Transcription termination factor nusG [Gracilaria domingensis]|nr:Transcription termination factor nusG [Gracilaria domingensis]